MKPTSARFLWLTAIIVYSALTVAVSFNSSVRLPLTQFRLDLLVHALEYGLLAWLIMRFLEASGFVLSRLKIVLLPIVVCAVIGGVNELLQLSVPGRYASWSDEAANVMGSVIAVALTYRRRSANWMKKTVQTGRIRVARVE